MRGVYKAQVEITSVSIAKTLLYGLVPSSIVAEILSATILNGSVNTAEQLRVGIFLVTTIGSPATTTAPTVHVQKTEQGSPATGLTFLGDLTTEPTTYDAAPLDQEFPNNIGGYYFNPLPEERLYIPPSRAFGLRLLNAPTNPFRANVQVIYREIG